MKTEDRNQKNNKLISIEENTQYFGIDQEYSLKWNQNLKKLFGFTLIFLIIDLVLQNYLFQISLPILKEIRISYSSQKGDLIFKIISEFGDKYIISCFVIFSYAFMDTPKAFTVALSAYSSLALLSILKSLKNEPRPFHVYDITPSKCWLEYGNPSGHSLLTSCLYLTFWQMLCLKKGWQKGSKEYNLSFWSFVFGILIVAVSRIYHGVHTFNQILNGWIWGTSLSILFSKFLYGELSRFVYNIPQFSYFRLIWNKGTINFYLIYVIAISLYIFGQKFHPLPQEWLLNIQKNCGQLSAYDKIDPVLQNFEKFNLFFSLSGIYLGLIVECKLMGTHIYYFGNESTLKIKIIKLIVCFIIGLPTLQGLLISKNKNPYLYVVIFKNIMPAWFGNFYMYAFTKWISLKLGFLNTRKPMEGEDPIYQININDVQKKQK